MPIPGGCMQFRTMPLYVDQSLGKTPFLRRSLMLTAFERQGPEVRILSLRPFSLVTTRSDSSMPFCRPRGQHTWQICSRPWEHVAVSHRAALNQLNKLFLSTPKPE